MWFHIVPLLFGNCAIRGDHIAPRRSALFMARSVPGTVQEGALQIRLHQIRLHKQATTTPGIGVAIQASPEPAWQAAEQCLCHDDALPDSSGWPKQNA